MSDDSMHDRRFHVFGWPALAIIAALVAIVLLLTYGANRAPPQVKPATGSAQAMSLASERGQAAHP